MGRIKKILDRELVGGSTNEEIYPISSTKAIYDTENRSLDDILKDYLNRLNKVYYNVGYYVCSTPGNDADKEIFIPDFTLSTNIRLIVRMASKNTTDNVSFEINDTGAYPLLYNNLAVSESNTWIDGETLDVYFDGDNFQAFNIKGGGGGSGGGGEVPLDGPLQPGEGIDITMLNEAYVISHAITTSATSTDNQDDLILIHNVEIDKFGHVTNIESSKITLLLDKRYLRKDVDDTAHGNISFDKNIQSTIYLDGWEGFGWKIEDSGLGELDGLRVRSNIYMGGKIGSPSFASGFTGWGWEIDTPTASGTVDNWTVRKSMKVYELVYSQIYGLSGSVMITDFNKIKSVESLGTNRYHCIIDDMDGEMFMNLRNGDIVRVQKRDGWNIRYYYGEIENVSADAFDIKIIEGEDIPQEGDVCFRMGSKTDINRQGLVYLTSSDDYSAYIDILDGVDSPSFENKIKVRLGNLRGITVDGKPLNMHGIYINGGIFQHSTYYMENGNTVEQQFTIMDGKFESAIEGIRNDMSIESGNILKNSGFSTDTNYWYSKGDISFINIGDGFLWLPDNFYSEKRAVADIYRDGYRNVLRIRNNSIVQYNNILNIPEREEGDEELKNYSFAFFYKVKRAGTLTVGFKDSELYSEEFLTETEEYQKYVKVATWNEQGDFEIGFTGEILIYGVSLFNDALADATIKLETRIEQTEEYIKLLATKEYVDSETNAIYVKYDAELSVAAEQIGLRVTKSEYQAGMNSLENTLTGKINVQAGRIEAVAEDVDYINDTIQSAGWITSTEGNQLYAKKEMENGKTIISTINQTAEAVTIDADKINLNGVVTANKNFQILMDGSMKAVNGYFSGNIDATGRFQTSENGERFVIDGNDLQMYNSSGYLNFDISSYSAQAAINIYQRSGSSVVYQGFLNARQVEFLKSNTTFARLGYGGFFLKPGDGIIDADEINNYPSAYSAGTLYYDQYDGNRLKIKLD